MTATYTGNSKNSYTYDAAGRTASRTVDDVTTALTWDVTSSLTESDGQGGHVVYAYDASGQRVLQARVADAHGVGTASAYVASAQVDDPNTASTPTDDLAATRYYTFAGSTVAVRTNDGQLSLMLGDEQGSTHVVMTVTTTTGGAMVAATLADASAITRTSYTPYGVLRGADNLAVDRGWLGQVEDRIVGTGASSTGTGLTYLNARYYDPVLSLFLSPDPLMNPGDPRTLDPYRYADNNPVVFTDASGLSPCSGLSVAHEKSCMASYYKGTGYKAPSKPFTAIFARGVVKSVWKTLATDALNMTVYGTVKSTKLLVTNPKGFVGQYGQAWNTTKDVSKAWWDGTGSAFAVLKGDKSLGAHINQVRNSSAMAHIGESWDAKDADAVGSTWAHTVEIASIASGLKAGFKSNVPEGVPNPAPVFRANGAADRSSAVYVSVQRADGTIETVGSRPGGIHAEDVAQALEPGGQMSTPFGWRRPDADGPLTWQPINVCTQCQRSYSPTLFPPGTQGDPGGAWGK